MGISVAQLLTLKTRVIQEVASTRQSCEVLCFGYPDVLLTRSELIKEFGEEVVARFDFKPNCEAVWLWHGRKDCATEPMVDTPSLFRAFGATNIIIVDIVASRDVERIVDLNYPLPSDLKDRFALVIDPGTVEHCFNCGQAQKNLAEAVMLSGYIFTVGPLNMYNHGFYSFNPTMYVDFYGQNGFEVIDIFGTDPSTLSLFQLNTTQRFNNAPEGSSIGAIVKKMEKRPIVWPTQTKYL